MKQHPNIINYADVKSKKPALLTFDYRLFEGSHVLDTDLTKSLGQNANEGYSSIFKKHQTSYVV